MVLRALRGSVAPTIAVAGLMTFTGGCAPDGTDAKGESSSIPGRPSASSTESNRSNSTLVRVDTLRRGSIRTAVDVSCDIEADHLVSVFSKVGNSYIDEILVDEGDQVEEGQPLVLLNVDDFEIEVRRREATMKQRKLAEAQNALSQRETAARQRAQQAQFERARADWERVQEATQGGVDVFSDKEMLDLEKAYQSALAELDALKLTAERTISDGEFAVLETESAQIELEAAQRDLALATVRAPVSGVVADRMVDPGLLVSPQTQLLTLMDPRQLISHLRIPQEDLLVVTGPGLPVEFVFDALPGHVFTGQVEAINPSVDPSSGLVRVRVRLADDAVGVVRPGMYARARIIVESRDDAYLLNKRAVVHDDGRSWFFVADEGVARRYEFAPGASTEHDVEVRSVVDLGDAALESLAIIHVGQDRLRDGDAVRVAETVTESGAAPSESP